jgi:hypothetical protein
LGFGKTEIFFARGLDTPNQLDPLQEISFWRNAVRLENALEPRFDGIEARLQILVLTRFLDANRFPLRLKTL